MEWRDTAIIIQFNVIYISTFLIAIIIYFSKELESGISKLVKFRNIFRTKKQILGLVNFNSRFLDLPSGVTAILN